MNAPFYWKGISLDLKRTEWIALLSFILFRMSEAMVFKEIDSNFN